MSKGALSTREAQRLATRERVFQAALVEVRRSGVAGADVSAIVREAGVAHGTFFFHFPTKEHVAAEIGNREEIRLAEQLDRFLVTPRDLRATLQEVVRLAAELEEELGTLLFNDVISLYFSPTPPEVVFGADHPLISRIIAEFQHARERGEIRDDPDIDPANVATFFFMGFFALLVTQTPSEHRSALLDQSIATLLRGLQGP